MIENNEERADRKQLLAIIRELRDELQTERAFSQQLREKSIRDIRISARCVRSCRSYGAASTCRRSARTSRKLSGARAKSTEHDRQPNHAR